MLLLFREIIKNALPYSGSAAIIMLVITLVAGIVRARLKERLLAIQKANANDIPGIIGDEIDKLGLKADKLTPEQQQKNIVRILKQREKRNFRNFILSIFVACLLTILVVLGLIIQNSGTSSPQPGRVSVVTKHLDYWQSFPNSKPSTDTNTGSAYDWPYCKQPCHMLIYSSRDPKEKIDNVTETTVEYNFPDNAEPMEAQLTIVATMNDKSKDDPARINDCKLMLVINGHYPGIPFPADGFPWGERNTLGGKHFINFSDITLTIPDASKLFKSWSNKNKIKYSLKCNSTNGFIVIKETILEIRFKKEFVTTATSNAF